MPNHVNYFPVRHSCLSCLRALCSANLDQRFRVFPDFVNKAQLTSLNSFLCHITAFYFLTSPKHAFLFSVRQNRNVHNYSLDFADEAQLYNDGRRLVDFLNTWQSHEENFFDRVMALSKQMVSQVRFPVVPFLY